MRLLFMVFVAFIGLTFHPVLAETSYLKLPENRDYSETLQTLLEQDELSIDLTFSKLVIDNLVDSSVDIEHSNKELENIADSLNAMMDGLNDPAIKIDALRNYIHQSGPWNNNQKYDYDFDDPNGRFAISKTLKKYMDTRKGNCVNMPIFFLALSEKLGIDVNITTAPRHIFIQFNNPQTGKLEHLETTSGSQPQRLVWQRQVFNMTDKAIENGMYMKRLNKREIIAVMAETLLQDLTQKKELDERLEVAELVHKTYPQFDVALMHLADGYQEKIMRDFQSKYPRVEDIPDDKMPVLDDLAIRRDYAGQLLRDLGWQRAKPNPNVVLPK